MGSILDFSEICKYNLSVDNNKINWFPGHMTKSLHGLDDYIKKCNLILYVLDARCPKSCLNPEFEQFLKRKPVLFILNKSDLALPDDFKGIALNSKQSNSADKIIPHIKRLFPTKTIIQAMVIGVPNSGKSTLINNFAKTAKAKTEDRPGVTRQPQWVQARLSPSAKLTLYFLDTPGILWPNLEDQHIARNLALIGSIRDDILDITQLVQTRVDLSDFARSRGHLLPGGQLDLERAAKAYLTDFRAGKFGRVNLDQGQP
ncbi:MAG: ribosome biogenesis GTPase YlqF [Christensenellaceae bacterium]|jgi:ribosome biogenesis GTPase A|nr:ribosome biogenesis GTPase YlqF [Christensenellaceae bacterium]